MNFTKDIYINKDKIIENSEIVILYKGFLFSNSLTKDVYLSYGYGNLWDNKKEIKMKPSTFGYLATVNIENGENLQFCFRDNENNWDNNSNYNYILPIEEDEEILSFKSIVSTSQNIDLNLNTEQQQQEVTLTNGNIEDIFEESIITSNPIDLYKTVDLENIQKQAIPNNTIFTKIEMNTNSENTISEATIKSQVTQNTIPIAFAQIVEKAKEQSVKAFDEGKVTAGSIYVNSLLNDIQENEVSEETSLIETKENSLHNGLSLFGTLFKNIKAAFGKVVKLIKTSLNLTEDEN